ncbi:MAG: cysteine--tRNA ligase [Chloroflexota bacterium]
MALRIYNTLTHQKEPFLPANDPVRFYCCGMTPKFFPHLGHGRLFVSMDVLRRYLLERGYQVRYVQNFTDVDDKIIARATQEGLDPATVAQKYTDGYFQSMEALNVLPADVYPKATETIPGIISMIDGLVARGYAYAPGNGDVYYRVAAFPSYGKLSHRTEEDVQPGARIAVEEQKGDPRDFALWKAAKEGEPRWQSPWGYGRPGWHIECSAMVRQELGDQIDIHAGGPDLIFPHHENEIAQSEAFTGCEPFAQYWVHIGQLNVNNEKMAHSTENFTTILAVLERYHPVVLRLYYLTQHYRTPSNFTDDSLEVTRRAAERLVMARRSLSALRAIAAASAPPALSGVPQPSAAGALQRQLNQARREFYEAMDDDFNTAVALTTLYGLSREINRLRDSTPLPGDAQEWAIVLDDIARTFEHFLAILGLQVPASAAELVRGAASGGPSDAEIEALVAKRAELRRQRRWADADAVRARLADQGISVEDRADGAVWRRGG